MKKTEKAARGQTIITETNPDRSSYNKQDANEALMGRKMGGGPRDTSHSLTSAGDTVDYMNKGRK